VLRILYDGPIEIRGKPSKLKNDKPRTTESRNSCCTNVTISSVKFCRIIEITNYTVERKNLEQQILVPKYYKREREFFRCENLLFGIFVFWFTMFLCSKFRLSRKNRFDTLIFKGLLSFQLKHRQLKQACLSLVLERKKIGNLQHFYFILFLFYCSHLFSTFVDRAFK